MTATQNETIQPQFRTIDGLSSRFAESEDRDDHALIYRSATTHDHNLRAAERGEKGRTCLAPSM